MKCSKTSKKESFSFSKRKRVFINPTRSKIKVLLFLNRSTFSIRSMQLSSGNWTRQRNPHFDLINRQIQGCIQRSDQKIDQRRKDADDYLGQQWPQQEKIANPSQLYTTVIFAVYFAKIMHLFIVLLVLFKKDKVFYDHPIRYFLYLSIFLLRISSMGPRSLLKASLSSETTLQSITALILACRTVFLTKAIYPK